MWSRTRRWRATLIAACAALTITAVAACSGQAATVGTSTKGDQKAVKIAVVNGWDEGIASAYVWKNLLESRGYTVTMQSLDSASAAYAATSGGQVDLFFSAMLPTTHAEYWKQTGDKLELSSEWYQGASNNLTVPAYMTGINSISDLKGKAAEFNGTITGIEAGSGLVSAAQGKVLSAYGLGDYKVTPSSTAAMLASLRTAIQAQKPIVVTLWQPHWAFSDMPLKPLADPDAAFGAPDHLNSISPKGWSQSKPEVAGWVKKYSMSNGQLADLELAIKKIGRAHV